MIKFVWFIGSFFFEAPDDKIPPVPRNSSKGIHFTKSIHFSEGLHLLNAPVGFSRFFPRERPTLRGVYKMLVLRFSINLIKSPSFIRLEFFLPDWLPFEI